MVNDQVAEDFWRIVDRATVRGESLNIDRLLRAMGLDSVPDRPQGATSDDVAKAAERYGEALRQLHADAPK